MLRRGEEYGPPRQRLHERGRGEPIEFGERSPAATNNRPPIGAVLNAMVTSIKPNHGVFTSLPLADGTAIQGLIHLSEVSDEISAMQDAIRRRGRGGDRNAYDDVNAKLHKIFTVDEDIPVRVLKYKYDRGNVVADLTVKNLSGPAPSSATKTEGTHYSNDGPMAGAPPRDSEITPASHRSAAMEGPPGVQPYARPLRPKPSPADIRTRAAARLPGQRRAGGRMPPLHSIHRVEILNAFHDGVFVKIPGFPHDGLIHHSQISRNLQLPLDMPKPERYRAINDLVGDIKSDVFAKVVYVCDEPDHTKCECSLKMVSQRDGRDLDPEHKMWLTYMKKRRSQGAGTYTAREMKDEFERVAATLEHAAAGGPESTPPASQPIAMPPSEAMRPAPHERSGYPAERPPAQPPNWPPLRGPSDLEPRGAPPPRQDAYARAPLGPDPRWSPHEPLRTAPPAGRGYYGDPYASEPAPRGALVRPPPDQVEGPPSRFADDPRYADGYGRQMPPPSYRLGPEDDLRYHGMPPQRAALQDFDRMRPVPAHAASHAYADASRHLPPADPRGGPPPHYADDLRGRPLRPTEYEPHLAPRAAASDPYGDAYERGASAYAQQRAAAEGSPRIELGDVQRMQGGSGGAAAYDDGHGGPYDVPPREAKPAERVAASPAPANGASDGGHAGSAPAPAAASAGTDVAMAEMTPAMREMIKAMVAENTAAQVAAALEEERRKRKKKHRSSREREHEGSEGPEQRRHRARSDSRSRSR